MNAVAGAMNVNIKVIDGTGTVEVRQWPESKEEGEALVDSLPYVLCLLSSDPFSLLDDHVQMAVRQMSWIRVLGNLKTFNDKKHVMAGRIQLITDHNEVFYHFLEALHSHLYFTQGPLGENGAPVTDTSGIPSAYTSAGGNNKMDVDDITSGWDPIARRMYHWIKDHTTDATEGVAMTAMAKGIKDSGASAQQISYVWTYTK